jgi:hypothetical protein
MPATHGKPADRRGSPQKHHDCSDDISRRFTVADPACLASDSGDDVLARL